MEFSKSRYEGVVEELSFQELPIFIKQNWAAKRPSFNHLGLDDPPHAT